MARSQPFGSVAWNEQTAERLGLQSTFRATGRPRKPTGTARLGSCPEKGLRPLFVFLSSFFLPLPHDLGLATVDGMELIQAIRDKIASGDFEFSQHALDQSILRRVSVQELREAIAVGEVIEDYPSDKYGPSCLILGFTGVGRPLHIQCSSSSRPLVKVITLYEPDPTQWVDFKQRRS